MRHCEKPGEATGKCAAYAVVEAQGLERGWGEAQAWPYEARLESLKRA